MGAALAPVLGVGMTEVHLDLTRDPGQLDAALRIAADTGVRLSLGVVDGRNVWATDPGRVLPLIDAAVEALGPDRVTLATSCSLLHVPYSAARETRLDPEVRSWLAFAIEKMAELTTLARAAVATGAAREEIVAPMAAVAANRRGAGDRTR
jgi:5-methyltetrahydropteroyltriglutamate--homocysteine methyltransferase